MKAYYSMRYGGPEYSFYGDVPEPAKKNDELLIEVKAVSVNPVDYKIMSGAARIVSGSAFPKIFGTDFAGIVKKPAAGDSGFSPGDRVYGSSSVIFGRQGALAEILSVRPEKLRHMPEIITFEEAASLPVAALTALNGIRKCRVITGSRILVNGATGGVGHFAVQIARAKGADVTATCSGSNAELAKKLGAAMATGYDKESLDRLTPGFDSIMDAYGNMGFNHINHLLKKGGVYASTLFFPPSQFIAMYARIFKGIIMTSSNMRARNEDYEEIEKLLKEKKLIPLIDSIFPLSKCGDAFYHAINGKPKGKIIVTI